MGKSLIEDLSSGNVPSGAIKKDAFSKVYDISGGNLSTEYTSEVLDTDKKEFTLVKPDKKWLDNEEFWRCCFNQWLGPYVRLGCLYGLYRSKVSCL